MDQFLKDQIINSIKYIPTNIVKSYFIKDLSEDKAIRKKHGFIRGAIVFSYSDCEKCAYCGQNDCPTETRWGLVDVNGNPKPSYYAVKEAYGGFIEKDRNYK